MKGIGKGWLGKGRKKFWRLISLPDLGCSCKLNNCITADTWCSYFSNIFESDASLRSNNVRPIQTLLTTLPEWPSVTEQEVCELIDVLATDKAPGEDMIPPKVYKSNSDWWAPLLAKLLTHINATGIFPKGWRKSIIFPIYKKR